MSTTAPPPSACADGCLSPHSHGPVSASVAPPSPTLKDVIESVLAYWKQIDTSVRALLISVFFLLLPYYTSPFIGYGSIAVYLAGQVVQAHQFHYRYPEAVINNPHISALFVVVASGISVADDRLRRGDVYRLSARDLVTICVCIAAIGFSFLCFCTIVLRRAFAVIIAPLTCERKLE